MTLSAASGQNVSVGYNTSNGTATAGADYTSTSGTLTFVPGGPLTQTVTVTIANDTTYEGSETFNVNLVTPTNATISDNLGLGTIKDDGTGIGGTDNDTPSLAVSNVGVTEGTDAYAQFAVTLSNQSATPTTVGLALTAGTAAGAGVDYGTAGAGNLQVSTDGGTTWIDATSVTIAAGTTSVLVRTPITNDALDEAAENFTLTATTTAGTTSNASAIGTATITDNDPTPSLSINDITVNEAAGTATFTVLHRDQRHPHLRPGRPPHANHHGRDRQRHPL
ncbi:Calx-beta domain-containing protein [Rhizobacter sp. Root404]|uniref:Calx-beta domain-containing protein n=1 Tax=Rhizobacter sp. Root404 TaxID=1736528 RepID=UPI001F1A06FA|nr:Calx-beta domain-containing protein [Rhizobacter sp. Root404]